MKHLRTFLEKLSNDELNSILDKISKSGVDSLSNHERNLLNNYDNKEFDSDEEIRKHQAKYKTSKGVPSIVGLNVDNHDLEKDIGRYARFKKPANEDEAKQMGLIKAKGTIFEIVGVQKHWGHNSEGKYVPDMIGYRVAMVGKENDFGSVMSVKEAEFLNNITEEEAIEFNKSLGYI